MRRGTNPIIFHAAPPAAVVAAVSAALAAVPAAAAPHAEAAPEAATFRPARAGALTISAPAAVSMGSTTPGGHLAVQMGTVTVTDTREPGAGPWTVTVSSTDYSRTTAPVVTISRSNMTYWSGPATATQGGGNFIPGQPTAAQQVSLSVPRTAFSRTTQNGVNNCSWIPTLNVSVPFAGVTTGVYRGVITHSVA
ncbi:hypothetical protein [Microbispora sp. ATCC PTA-5024]|uniref:hypothetical protein n=1 Tax=Microbispora sp. ATCC PTA-5024 TaxID=316330 RepID=UPI00040E9889|nr:hypothetical protein [Microbispora sp. ATCC PTA-5024]